MRKLSLGLGLYVALLIEPAYGYIGPGVGAGTIAVVLGVIAALFLALVAIVWYPFKRLFRNRKSAEKNSVVTSDSGNELARDDDSLHHRD